MVIRKLAEYQRIIHNLIIIHPMEFTYTAVTKDGRRQTSTIEAPNLATAGHL